MEQKSLISPESHNKLVEKLVKEEAYLILETHFEKGRIARVKTHNTLLDHDVKRLIEK